MPRGVSRRRGHARDDLLGRRCSVRVLGSVRLVRRRFQPALLNPSKRRRRGDRAGSPQETAAHRPARRPRWPMMVRRPGRNPSTRTSRVMASCSAASGRVHSRDHFGEAQESRHPDIHGGGDAFLAVHPEAARVREQLLYSGQINDRDRLLRRKKDQPGRHVGDPTGRVIWRGGDHIDAFFQERSSTSSCG